MSMSYLARAFASVCSFILSDNNTTIITMHILIGIDREWEWQKIFTMRNSHNAAQCKERPQSEKFEHEIEFIQLIIGYLVTSLSDKYSQILLSHGGEVWSKIW